MTLTVAIAGRPNVGKSTLFNRLVGRRRALVDPTPGVTRDRIEGEARIGHLRFAAIDTAGREEEGDEASLPGRLRAQTSAALDEADVALFLIDARSGLTAADRHFAAWLRRQDKPVVLVANKCEGLAAEAFAAEAWGLGLGEPVPISAQNGEGMADLLEALLPYAEAAEEREAPGEAEEEEGGPLRLVVVGRPNVGKSSLINRLLREERLLTGPEPGLTRDAVATSWEWRGRRIELVDTAGLRRKARIAAGGLERMSAAATVEALRRSHVALLLVDAAAPLEKQDLAIANLAIDEGRALVIGVNKWDLVDDPAAATRLVRDRLTARLPQVRGVPWLPLSVKTGRNMDGLPEAVVAAFDRWNRRVPTAAFNRWLGETLATHPPPMVRGRRIKIRYGTQVRTRPPTFVLFTSQPEDLPESYLRYLTGGLREAFDLPGVPLRLGLRKGRNPYAPDR
ncbi:MAG TPA: ribosome biogenesis GTPase Der [Geminicoccaceae bacterium]|nr:ribosome biogenesis GTPase Der [Geminicoccaceae bacterium]